MNKPSRLCHVVLGALTSLRHLPVDVLVRGLDVARLAVDAAVFELANDWAEAN